jgi:transcriptional regulator with XRE-family HTH domain
VYERFLQKWFGLDPVRSRDRRPADHPMVTIGRQVREARVHASLTQRQVEDLTGIDQASVSRLETGKRAAMRLDRFAQLLVAIDAEIRPAPGNLPTWLAPAMPPDDRLSDEELSEDDASVAWLPDDGPEPDDRLLLPDAAILREAPDSDRDVPGPDETSPPSGESDPGEVTDNAARRRRLGHEDGGRPSGTAGDTGAGAPTAALAAPWAQTCWQDC